MIDFYLKNIEETKTYKSKENEYIIISIFAELISFIYIEIIECHKIMVEDIFILFLVFV